MSGPSDAVLRPRFLDPIPEINDAAMLLSRAADAHLAGEAAEAERLIRLADMPQIASWTKRLWGREDPLLHAFRIVPGAPPTLPKEARPQPRMPGVSVKTAIEARDGLRCRFCGIPVIRPTVRGFLVNVYPEAARWGPKEEDQHAALQCLWLQYDHLVPHSRGGESTVENVVITCAPCNFARGNRTLEEAWLRNPLSVAPPPQNGWDGLDRLLAAVPHPVAKGLPLGDAVGKEASEPHFEAALADQLDDLEASLADLGVWVETTGDKTRMLRWQAPSGDRFTLGALREDGTLSTYDVCWPAHQCGRLALAHAYLELLAALIGGSVRRTPSEHQWHVRSATQALPALTEVLSVKTAWLAVMNGYLAALSIALATGSTRPVVAP